MTSPLAVCLVPTRFYSTCCTHDSSHGRRLMDCCYGHSASQLAHSPAATATATNPSHLELLAPCWMFSHPPAAPAAESAAACRAPLAGHSCSPAPAAQCHPSWAWQAAHAAPWQQPAGHKRVQGHNTQQHLATMLDWVHVVQQLQFPAGAWRETGVLLQRS